MKDLEHQPSQNSVLAQTIAEKGASYCKNPDLYTFLFGKMNYRSRKALDRYFNSGDRHLIEELPKKVKLKFSAFMELGDRYFLKTGTTITHSREIAELCSDMKDLKQEHFVVLTLNGGNTVIARRTVFVGTLNRSLVHPREVFADAITDRAANIVIVHNHPSGNIEPSLEDIEMTQKLMKVGELVSIPIIDHVIVTKNGHYSFHGNGKI